MLTFVNTRNRLAVEGGLAGSMLEYREARRLANVLVDTTLALGATFPLVAPVPNPARNGLHNHLVGVEQLLTCRPGSLVQLPARQALNPTVVGAVEVLAGPVTFDNVERLGAYIFELVSVNAEARVLGLKLVATVQAEVPLPEVYDPEPTFLTWGCLWKWSVPVGDPGKIFLGGEELATYMEFLGRAPMTAAGLIAERVDGLGVAAVAPAGALAVAHQGKLGYINCIDPDGRSWRSTSWEKFQADFQARCNLVRSANRLRFGMIAGEHTVKVDHAVWTSKLMSCEHLSPCPPWADTVGLLSNVRRLNVWGKEEMFYAGKVSRTDYSFISWEQFVPKGHTYERDTNFNSLLLACEGFRAWNTYSYGTAWNAVTARFRARLETGDLKDCYPEHVHYLAHAALVQFYGMSTTPSAHVDYPFDSEDAAPEIFDRCLEEVVRCVLLDTSSHWRKYDLLWKSEISFGIGAKRALITLDQGGSGAGSKKAQIQFHLTARARVCWPSVEKAIGCDRLTLDNGKVRARGCIGAQCSFYHLDLNKLPDQAELLANMRASPLLTPADKTKLGPKIQNLY